MDKNPLGEGQLTAVPNIRKISLLSLFTIRFCCLSYKTGTVKRPE